MATMNVTIPDDIALSTGPQLIGTMFNWGLLGMLTVQVYIFYLCFPNDRVSVKCLVYILYFLEWVQTTLTTVDEFHWFVYNWGRPDLDTLLSINTSWFNVPLMDGVISAIVQMFFGWQIWSLGRSPWVPSLIAVIALAQASAGIATGVKLEAFGTFKEINGLFPSITVWHVGEATADLIIAVTMTYLLLSKKSGLPKTDYLLGRIIRLFVETGSITSTATLVDLVLYYVSKKSTLHECPAIILPKLYTNTLLAVLNNRVFTARSKWSNTESSVQTFFNARGILANGTTTVADQEQANSAGIRIDIRTEVPLEDFNRQYETDVIKQLPA